MNFNNFFTIKFINIPYLIYPHISNINFIIGSSNVFQIQEFWLLFKIIKYVLFPTQT